MALNTVTIITKCLEVCQKAITKTNGIPTQAINETINNLNFIRTTVLNNLDNAIDVYNALKNAANSFSIIAGMGADIEKEQTSTQGFATENDYIVNERANDRYAPFMTISTVIAGGETGNYSGISRGNIVKIDGEIIPNILGRSLINNMLDAINNFTVQELGYATNEQTNNIVLIIETFKLQILINICRIVIRTDFFSQDEILEYKDLIGEGFDNYINDLSLTSSGGSSAINIGSSTTQIDNNKRFEIADKMREIIINELVIKSGDLIKSYNYTIQPDVENTLILAYEKYEDINRNEEIFLKNKEQIKSPGFLPNGDNIRILSR